MTCNSCGLPAHSDPCDFCKEVERSMDRLKSLETEEIEEGGVSHAS